MKKFYLRFFSGVLSFVMLLSCVTEESVSAVRELFGMKAGAVSYSVGDILDFGSYPQSEVTEKSMISALNLAPKSWLSYDYYTGTGSYSDGQMTSGDYMKYCDVTLGGVKYRGVKFTQYRPYCTSYTSSADNSYQDDNGYGPNTTYWFKYEPLSWRVLDPSTGLVLCEKIIDSQPYNNYLLYYGGKCYGDSAKNNYANNYTYSSIRNWLTEEGDETSFLNTAFTEKQREDVLYTKLDNSAYSSSYSKYDSPGTTDKVFLLSYFDVLNTSYGFPSSTGSDISRQAKGTDYAKCQGLYETTYKENKCSYWQLRSAGDSSDTTCFVNYGGWVFNSYSYNAYGHHNGVRPALRLNLGSAISESVDLKGLDELAADEYGIFVMDNYGEPISGASVQWNSTKKSTDKNGLAKFKMTTFGQPEITVSKTDYITWKSNSSYTKSEDRYEIVTLYKTGSEEAHMMQSVYYQAGMIFSNILYRTKKVSLNATDSASFSLYCSPNSVTGIREVQLWQGDKKVAVASGPASGVYQFSKVSVKSFSEGGGVSVRAYTSSTEYVATPLNLQFYQDKKNDDDLKIDLFGKKQTFSIGGDVPYVGDSDLTVDFPMLPLNVYYAVNDDGSQKVHVAFNYDFEPWERDDKKEQEELAKASSDSEKKGIMARYKAERDKKKKELSDGIALIKNAKNAVVKDKDLKKLKKLCKEDNEANFCNKASIAIIGYGEGAWDPEGMNSITVDICVVGKVKMADVSWTWVAWIVPFTIRIESNFSLTLGGTGSYDFKAKTYNLDGRCNPKVDLEAFGGVGIGKVVGVGAYGSAELDAMIKFGSSKKGIESIDLTGDCGFEAYFTIFSYKKSFAYKTWQLYRPKAKLTDKAVSVNAAYSAAFEPYDLNNYTVQDISYLSNESEWLSKPPADKKRMLSSKASASASGGIENLLTGTYRNSAPVLASTGDVAVMAYTGADTSRSVYNLTRVMYSVYDSKSGTWSEPLQLDSNKTLDTAPFIYSDGNDIYLAYMDAARTYTSADDINSYVNSQNIAVAKFNRATGKFDAPVTIAKAAGRFLSSPTVGRYNGKITVAYQVNAADDPFGLSKVSSIGVSSVDGKIKETINASGTVVGCAVGEDGIAYVTDSDKDLGTVDDRTLYLYKNNSTAVSDGVISNPVYSEDGLLFWYQDGSLYTLDSGSPKNLYPEGIAGFSDKFSVTDDKIVYLAADHGVNNVFALNRTDESYGMPVQLTRQDKAIDSMSAATFNGECLAVMTRKDVDITDEQVISDCALSYTFLGNVSDVVNNGAEYDLDAVEPGKALPVTVSVTNNGDSTLSAVSVKIKDDSGKTVLSKTAASNIKSGESGSVTVNYTLPSSLEYSEYSVEVSDPYLSDVDNSNNLTDLSIGYTELSLNSEHIRVGENNFAVVTVTNNSYVDSDSILEAYVGDELISTETIPSLEHGCSYIVKMALDNERFQNDTSVIDFKVIPAKKQFREASLREQLYVDLDYVTVEEKPGTFTLSYDANGGDGAPSIQLGNGSLTLSDTQPTRIGYTYLGWATSAGATAAQYQPGDSFSLTKDTTLYAVWQKNGTTPSQGKVRSVSIDDTTVNWKSSVTLKPNIDADDGVKTTVTYSSSDPSVATVNDKGEVYGAKRGTATITCTVTDEAGNTVRDTCKVTVKYTFLQWLIKIFLLGFIWYK